MSQRPLLSVVVLTPVFLASLFVMSVFQGCVTAPPPKPPTHEEIVRRENAVGSRLSEKFESKISIRRDPELTVYLRDLTERLSSTSSELRGYSVGVLLLNESRESRSKGLWKDYALPGNRIYLSTGMLRQIQYENELAAAIALQLGNLVQKNVLIRLQEIVSSHHSPSTNSINAPDLALLSRMTLEDQDIDFEGPNGLFVFPEKMRLAAIDSAIDLLYASGFDPRGLSSLWTLYSEHRDRSPYDQSTLQHFQERTRQSLASYAPLRNPVVRSAQFITLEKRFKRL